MSLRFSVTVVEAGTEKVPVGAPIATIVHTEEDIALYRAAQETLGINLSPSSIHPPLFRTYMMARELDRICVKRPCLP